LKLAASVQGDDQLCPVWRQQPRQIEWLSMPLNVIETLGHTTSEGKLQLDLNVGVASADVAVTVRVMPSAANVDANGWPVDFFEKVAGSMPELSRPTQDDFEERTPLA
jgi:hypothetical protein